jgi:hypothetical protein
LALLLDLSRRMTHSSDKIEAAVITEDINRLFDELAGENAVALRQQLQVHRTRILTLCSEYYGVERELPTAERKREIIAELRELSGPLLLHLSADASVAH